jgi:hypothetical protein
VFFLGGTTDFGSFPSNGRQMTRALWTMVFNLITMGRIDFENREDSCCMLLAHMKTIQYQSQCEE